MITMQQFMEAINYRISEGGDYGWNCYGSHSHQLSAWNGVHGTGGWSANIVFSTKSQKVYEVAVCDYTHERAYRLINPKYQAKNTAEAAQRGESANQAWDDVNYIDLDVEEDFLEKLEAIVAGKVYDTRVQMQVDFSDEELLTYMNLAHQQDMTFNEFVEQALKAVLEQHKLDKFTDDYGQDLG